MDYFEPFNNALGQFSQNQRQFAGDRMRNENRLLELQDRDMAMQDRERQSAMQKIQFVGPLAVSVMEAQDKPSAYKASLQQVESVFGQNPQAPREWGPEAEDNIKQMADVYYQLHPEKAAERKNAMERTSSDDYMNRVREPFTQMPSDDNLAFLYANAPNETARKEIEGMRSFIPKKSEKKDIFTEKIDIGDRVRAWSPDGTFQDFPKKASPSTIIQQDTRKASDEMAIRKEFQSLPEVKTHVEISSQIQRLNKAMEENAKGGNKVAVDQALITVLNKMLDPSSVVRESEYARTPQDLAFLNRMKGKIDKLQTGGAGLTDEDRVAIANMARNFADVSQGMYDEQAKYYSGLSERYGYSPENIVRLGGGKRVGDEKNAANTSIQDAARAELERRAKGIR